MFEIVNDGLFRLEFLRETALNKPEYLVLPTFTLNEEPDVWLIEIEAFGLTYDGPAFEETGTQQLSWFMRQYKPLSVHRFVMLSVRERIILPKHTELAIHYNSVVLDLHSSLAYYFESGVGLWPVSIVPLLDETFKIPEVREFYQQSFQIRSAIPLCRIQLPRKEEKAGLDPDNFCQTWSLWVLDDFILSGSTWEIIRRQLDEWQRTKTQDDLRRILFDQFLIPRVRESQAYLVALRSDRFNWSKVVSVV